MYVWDVVSNKFESLVDSTAIWVSNLRVNISCTDVSALISRIFSKRVTQRKLACIFANYWHCIFQAPRMNFLRLRNNAFESIRIIIAILFEYVTLSDLSISRIAVRHFRNRVNSSECWVTFCLNLLNIDHKQFTSLCGKRKVTGSSKYLILSNETSGSEREDISYRI